MFLMVVLLIWQLCGKNNGVTSGVVAAHRLEKKKTTKLDAVIPIEVIVRARTLAFSLSTSKPTVGQHAEQLVPPLTVKKKRGKNTELYKSDNKRETRKSSMQPRF